jgi:ribosomal protein L37E
MNGEERRTRWLCPDCGDELWECQWYICDPVGLGHRVRCRKCEWSRKVFIDNIHRMDAAELFEGLSMRPLRKRGFITPLGEVVVTRTE